MVKLWSLSLNTNYGIKRENLLRSKFGSKRAEVTGGLGKLNILSPSSALKIETVCFTETLADTDESAWRQNPENRHQ
jgi:hypothetical protein